MIRRFATGSSKNDAEQILDEGIQRAREIDDKGLESIHLSLKAFLNGLHGRPHMGFEMVLDAERMAMESGDRVAIGASKVYRALLERWLGRPGNAVQLLDPIVPMVRSLSSRSRLINFLWLLGLAFSETGQVEKAIKLLKEGIDLSQKFGIPQRLGALHNTLGYCYGEICLPDFALRENLESRELSGRHMAQYPTGEHVYAEICAQASVNLMENLYDQGKIDEALIMHESLKEESTREVYFLARHRWEARMNYLLAHILLYRGEIEKAAAVIRENLEKVREVHSKKIEGGFLRLLGEVQIRRGESDSAISNLNEAVTILKEVGNPRQLWQAYSSLASAYDTIGQPGEAREQWGAAAEVIQNVANGLSDSELRGGFLNAEPIREILSRAQ